MWIRTVNGMAWVEAERTEQGVWIIKNKYNNE